MGIGRGIEAFTNKVAHVPKADEDEIADVGGEKDVVWRVVFDVGGDLGTGDMGRGESEPLVCAMAKLCVDGGEDLLRGGGAGRERETVVVVVVVVEGGVLGRGGEGRGDGESGGGGGGADMVVVAAGPGVGLAEGAEVGGSGGHGGGEGLGLALPEEGGLCESHGGRRQRGAHGRGLVLVRRAGSRRNSVSLGIPTLPLYS